MTTKHKARSTPPPPAAKKRHSPFARLSLADKIFFAKRLSILLKAGVPILSALHMLKKQASSKTATRIFEDMSTDVESGQYLSSAMARHRRLFGDFAVNLVQIGEASGTLHENLGYLAEELKKAQSLRQKVIGSLIYPVFIVIATIGITGLLTLYVFPKILPIFKSFRFDLPPTTRALIFISELFLTRGWAILFSLFIFTAICIAALRVTKVRYLAERALLGVPVLGALLQNYQMSNFCRTLGILLRSDTRIVEAVNIVAATTPNLVYTRQYQALAAKVTKGEKLSAHLSEDPKLFPLVLSQMVSVGETTGNLSSTLLYLADIYEEEVENLTKNLSTVIEPALMIVVGVLVGFIALSIITPIYGVTQNLHP